MSDVAIKFDHLTETQAEHKGKLGELEDRLDNHSSAIQGLADWRDGIGEAKGAEARLQCAESEIKDLPVMRADIEVVKLVANAKLEDISSTIRNTLDARDRTVIAYLKAWGPIIATAVILVGMILDKVMR